MGEVNGRHRNNLLVVLRVEIRLETIHVESFQFKVACDFSLMLNEEKSMLELGCVENLYSGYCRMGKGQDN